MSFQGIVKFVLLPLIGALIFCHGSRSEPKDVESPGDVGASSQSCASGTTEAKCFDPSKKVDRYISCANSDKYYQFSSTASSQFDEYCKSEVEVTLKESASKDWLQDSDIDALVKQDSCQKGDRLEARYIDKDFIRDVLRDKRLRPGRSPLRFNDAIFCNRLDIVGLDLTPSMVFDRSIFLNGLSLQYVNAAGNISFNDALVFRDIFINRSKISGGIFARNVAMQEFRLLESNTDLGVDLTGSVISQKVELTGVRVGKSLDLSNLVAVDLQIKRSSIGGRINMNRMAALGRFVVDQVDVLYAVDLQKSSLSDTYISGSRFSAPVIVNKVDVRCNFSLNNSGVSGQLLISDLNFNATSRLVGNKNRVEQLSSWSIETKKDILRRIQDKISSRDLQLSNLIDSAQLQIYPSFRSILRSVDEKMCADDYAAIPTLEISSLRVDGNLCLRNVQISEVTPADSPFAQDGRKRLIPISLLGTKVTASTLFMPPNMGSNSGGEIAPGVIDFTNFQTASLLISFGTKVSAGLSFRTAGSHFDRIFEGNGDRGSFDVSDTLTNHVSRCFSKFAIPDDDKLLAWLKMSDTTLPYASAIDAYGKIGRDATDIKVEKANAELHTEFTKKSALVAERISKFGFTSWLTKYAVSDMGDYIVFLKNFILGLLADFGFRPQKVFLILVIATSIFTVWIRYYLRIDRAESEIAGRVFKVGSLFVLDRMIPVYSIDECYSKVKEFRFKNGSAVDPLTLRKLFITIRAMKIFGIVATIFAAAALNTLIAQ